MKLLCVGGYADGRRVDVIDGLMKIEVRNYPRRPLGYAYDIDKNVCEAFVSTTYTVRRINGPGGTFLEFLAPIGVLDEDAIKCVFDCYIAIPNELKNPGDP